MHVGHVYLPCLIPRCCRSSIPLEYICYSRDTWWAFERVVSRYYCVRWIDVLRGFAFLFSVLQFWILHFQDCVVWFLTVRPSLSHIVDVFLAVSLLSARFACGVSGG